MNNGQIFARNFKQLREDHNLHQCQVAEALELRPQTISQWEAKGLRPRSPEVIKRLCDFFSVTESDLFWFSDGYYERHKITNNIQNVFSDNSFIAKTENGSYPVPSRIVEQFPDGFVLRALDTSMSHSLPEGACVYVNKAAIPSTEDIVAIRFKGEIFCRRITVYDEVYILDVDTCATQYKRLLIDRTSPPNGFMLLGKIVWMEKEY